MDIILLERIEKLGTIGDVVTVQDGLPIYYDEETSPVSAVRVVHPTNPKAPSVNHSIVMLYVPPHAEMSLHSHRERMQDPEAFRAWLGIGVTLRDLDAAGEVLAAVVAAGHDVKAQVASRPIGVLLGFQATANPFLFCASYGEVAQLPLPQRVDALADPERRRRIIAEHAELAATAPDGIFRQILTQFDTMFRLGDPVLAWGAAWQRLLAGEGWGDDLSAGKRQVLESCVRGLDVRPGVIEGSVVAGQKKPQRVQLRLNSLTQADWARLVRQVIDDGNESGALAALESQTVPVSLIDAADRHGMPLVPRRLVSIVAACTCGGARLPCDHVIAVHLALARKLDAEPLVLLAFRGGKTAELLELFARVRDELRALPEAKAAVEVDPFAPGAGPDPDWSLLERAPVPRPPLPLPEGWRARETFDALVRRLIAAVRQASQRPSSP